MTPSSTKWSIRRRSLEESIKPKHHSRSSLQTSGSTETERSSQHQKPPKDDDDDSIVVPLRSVNQTQLDGRNNESSVVESYSCVFRNTKGTLYASAEGIVFEGQQQRRRRRFLPLPIVQTKCSVQLDWKDIVEIVHTNIDGSSDDDKTITPTNNSTTTTTSTTDTTRSRRSISFLTRRNKRKQFDFAKSSHSDKAIDTIRSLHHQATNGSSIGSTCHSSTTSSSSSSCSSNASSVSLSESENVNARDAWNKFQLERTSHCGTKSYPTIAIQDTVLPSSLDSFFDTFVADSATCSLQSLHEQSGDVNVVVTPWTREQQPDSTVKSSSCSDDDSYIRTVEYQHKVNLSFAPPLALVRKQQRYRKYGPYGLVLETDTYIHDVPLSKYFYVADRIVVEPCNNDDDRNNNNSVLIQAALDVRFVKKIMFQSLITAETGKKHAQSLQELHAYWSQSLEAGATRTTSCQLSSLASSSSKTLVVFTDEPLGPMNHEDKVITPLNGACCHKPVATCTVQQLMNRRLALPFISTTTMMTNNGTLHAAIVIVGLLSFLFVAVTACYGNSAI